MLLGKNKKRKASNKSDFNLLPCLRSIDGINDFSKCPVCTSMIESVSGTSVDLGLDKIYCSVGISEKESTMLYILDVSIAEAIAFFQFKHNLVGNAFVLTYDSVSSKCVLDSYHPTNFSFPELTSIDVFKMLVTGNYINIGIANADGLILVKAFDLVVFPVMIHSKFPSKNVDVFKETILDILNVN